MAMVAQNVFRLTDVMYAADNGTTGAVTNNGGAYDTGLYLVTIVGGLEKNPTSGYSASGSLDYVVEGSQPLLVKSLSKSDAVFKAVTGSVYVADTQRSYAVGGSSAFRWYPDLMIGGASVGPALAIEDQYGLSNSDNDFDDYYFLVDVQQVTGDVDADSDNSSSIGEIEHSAAEEEQEDMSPGKVVAVSTAAEQVVAPLEVMLSNFSPSGSKVQFTGNSNLFHLWSENPSIAGTAVQLSFGTEYLASAAPVGFTSGQWRRFYVEALAPGSGEIGVSLGPLSDGGWKEVDRVTFTGVLVDIDTNSDNKNGIDPDNDPTTGTDDPIENDPAKPGRILGVNEDDDNNDGVADLTPSPPGETQVLGENDLAEVALRPLFTPNEFGTYFAKLKVSGPVKLWYASDKIAPVAIDANGIASWDLAGEGPPPSIRVEGLTSGTATLEYWLDGPAGADAVPHDFIQLTIIKVDISIDSNNSGALTPADDSIEDDPSRSGKWLQVNARDYDKDGVPGFADGLSLALGGMHTATDDGPRVNFDYAYGTIAFPENLDLSNAMVRFLGVTTASPATTGITHYTDGVASYSLPAFNDRNLRLWVPSGFTDRNGTLLVQRDVNEIDLGGNWIKGGKWYSPSDLGFTPEKLVRGIYVEGLNASSTTASERLVFELAPIGSASANLFSDAVRLTIAQINLDVASGPTGTLPVAIRAEQREEIGEGAYALVNNGNRDDDQYIDSLDGYDGGPIVPGQGATNVVNGGINASANFTPVDLSLSSAIDINASTITFEYSASPPTAIAFDNNNEVIPVPAALRLWTKDGSVPRNAQSILSGQGDYVPSGVAITPAALGLSSSNRKIRLYAEGITPRQLQDGSIKVTVASTDTNGTHDIADDLVAATVANRALSGAIEYSLASGRSPVRHAYVTLKHNSSSSDLANGFTDENGRFTLFLPATDDPIDLRAYTLTVFTESDPELDPTSTVQRTVSVGTFGGSYYVQPQLPFVEISAANPLVFLDYTGINAIGAGRSTQEEHTSTEKAFWVFDAAVTGAQFHEKLPGVSSGNVAYYFPTSIFTTAYDHITGYIDVADADARNWDRLLHEYGHVVADENGFDRTDYSEDPSHSDGVNLRIYHPTDFDFAAQLAFNEGWANTYSLLAEAHGTVPGSVAFIAEKDPFDGRYEGSDPEANLIAEGGYGSEGAGEDEENTAMAVLWDLYDGQNETFDRVALGYAGLFNVLKNGSPHKLSDLEHALALAQVSADLSPVFQASNMTPIPIGIRSNASGQIGAVIPAGDLAPTFVWKNPQGHGAKYRDDLSTAMGDLFDEFTMQLTRRDPSGASVSFEIAVPASSIVAVPTNRPWTVGFTISASDWDAIKGNPGDWEWRMSGKWSGSEAVDGYVSTPFAFQVS